MDIKIRKKGIKMYKKFYKSIGLIFQLVLILVLVSLAILSFGTRLPYFSRLGLNFFAVTSGSMEPTIPVGSLIYAGKYKLGELKKGNIITFKVKNPETGKVSVATHRIEEVLREEEVKELEDGKEKKLIKYDFVTKGDANNTADARAVPSGNIIGLYQWHIAKVGYVTSFAQTGKGFLLLVILPASILIIWEFVSLITYIKNYYQEKTQKEIRKLKKRLEAKNKKIRKSGK